MTPARLSPQPEARGRLWSLLSATIQATPSLCGDLQWWETPPPISSKSEPARVGAQAMSRPGVFQESPRRAEEPSEGDSPLNTTRPPHSSSLTRVEGPLFL